MGEAERRRIDAAMLDSLAGTFRILSDGGPFVCSFNFEDVSLMLHRASEIVRPGPFGVVAGFRALGEKE